MTLPIRPHRLWKSPSALRHAREASLAIARGIMASRGTHATTATPRLVFEAAHGGEAHLALYHAEFPALLDALPPAFTALEWGAGMGWIAAMLAAEQRAGAVLGTEVLWAGETPHCEPNAHTFYRLAHAVPRLHEVLEFQFDATDELRRVHFRRPLHLLRADARHLPVDDATIDLLYSINCLEHIPTPADAFADAARVVRPGGIMFHATEPLYFSPFGHHLADIFPLPWGHLLWDEEDLARLAVEGAGPGREWAPGVPLAPHHLLQNVFPSLNGAPPSAIRHALLNGPWRVLAWNDIVVPAHRRWLDSVRPWEAIEGGNDLDALLLHGLRFRLQRTPPGARRGARWCLRFSPQTRDVARRQ